MAIVMSENGGIFRARSAESNRAVKFSKRRRLQMLAAGQGIAAVAAALVVGASAWNGVQLVRERANRVTLNPVVPMSVAQGETLWTLAKRYGDPAATQLDRVDTLARANGLSASATIHPGQQLVVPVENPREAALLQQLQPTLAKR